MLQTLSCPSLAFGVREKGKGLRTKTWLRVYGSGYEEGGQQQA
jgi:hypothetical protein